MHALQRVQIDRIVLQRNPKRDHKSAITSVQDQTTSSENRVTVGSAYLKAEALEQPEGAELLDLTPLRDGVRVQEQRHQVRQRCQHLPPREDGAWSHEEWMRSQR